MDDLHKAAEDELNPENPGQGEEFLDEAADDGADHGSSDGGKHKECDGVFLIIGLPHVGQHAQSHRTTGCGETGEEAEDDVCSVVLGECAFCWSVKSDRADNHVVTIERKQLQNPVQCGIHRFRP